MTKNIMPPQIITEGGWKENFATEITHYHVANGTQNLCDCTDIPNGGIYVGSHNNFNHKAVIKFDLTKFSKQITARADFISLKMVVKCNTVSKPGIAYINGQAVQPYAGETVEVDVSGCYVDGSEAMQVEITANEGDGFLGFDKSGVTMPLLKVDYPQYRVNKSTKNIGGLKGVKHTLDLSSGEVVTVIEDLKDNTLPIPLSLSHVYKKGSVENGLGTNYMLNIQEKLSKNANGEFIYQDALGDKHTFTEKYYYYADNGELIDITNDKANIKVEADGSLTYDHYNKIRKVIKKQYSSSGLSASGELKGFKNTALMEQRVDEVKQLEEQNSSYLEVLKDYILINKETGDVVLGRISNLENGYYEFVNNFSDINILLTISESMQYKSLKDRFNQINREITGESHYLENLALSSYVFGSEPKEEILASLKKQIMDLSNEIYLYVDNFSDDSSVITQKQGILNSLANGTEISLHHFGVINNKHCYYTWKNVSGSPNINGLALKSMIRSRNLLIKQLNRELSNINKEKTDILTQLNFFIQNSVKNMKNFKKYYKEYYNCNEQLQTLKRNMPINTISNGSITKGFNAECDLVVIYDNSQNAVWIDRDEDGKILKVQSEDKTVFNFEYVGGYLKRVSSQLGKRVEYSYSGGKLSAIKYSDGREMLLTYTSDNKVYSIVDKKDILKEQFAYAEDGKLNKREVYGIDAQFDHLSTFDTRNLSFDYLINKTDFYVEDLVITIEDALSTKKETYLLGTNKEIIEYYLEEDGLLVQAERYFQLNYGGKKTEYANKNNLRITGFDYRGYSFGVTDYEQTENTWFFKPNKITTRKILTDTKEVTTITDFTYNENEECILERVEETKLFNGEQIKTVYVTKHSYDLRGLELKTENYVEGEELLNGVDVQENVYNTNGNLLYNCSYNTLDPSNKYYSAAEYDQRGRKTAEYDASGKNKTTYEYNDNTEQVENTVYPNGSKLSQYSTEDVATITQSTEEGEENANIIYNRFGLKVKVKSGEQEVKYCYDKNRDLSSVDLFGREKSLRFTITKNQSSRLVPGKKTDTVNVRYFNSEHTETITDKHGNIRFKRFNGAHEIKYNYDDRCEKLLTENDMVTGETHEYSYDQEDRVTAHTFGNNKREYTYGADGEILTETVKSRSNSSVDWANADSLSYNYNYTSDSKKLLSQMSVGDLTENYVYDSLQRDKSITQSLGGNTYKKEYGYYKNGDRATNLVNTVYYKQNERRTDKITYTYDNMGNVISVNKNGEQVKAYTYDSLNRLIKENNIDIGREIVYTYDNLGNILSKTENGVESKYVYDEKGFKLLSFGNQEYTYNELHNQTNLNSTYYGLEWTKAKLLTRANGVSGYSLNFTYDGNHLMTGKTGNGSTSQYFYESGKLIREITNGIETKYIYGKEGLLGFIYNGATYLYQKNIFGDIEKIIDSTGVVVGEYSYTAFGECSVITNVNNIANVNPFRYRGYFYERNSGLYYLKTRFYNPVIGRFISPDDTKYLQPETINGLNLFAYCGNNPVMNIDPNGTFFLTALAVGALVGAGIGFGATVYQDYKDDGEVFNGSIKWYDYVGATALGGLVGAGVGAVAAWSAPYISSFASSAFTFGGGFALSGGAGAVSAGLTVTGTQILVGAGAIAGLGIILSKIPYKGKPNSTIEQGGSIGKYDENGNLVSRQDTTGRPHYIKELGGYFLPHTHTYKWKLINEIWRIISKNVLPF